MKVKKKKKLQEIFVWKISLHCVWLSRIRKYIERVFETPALDLILWNHRSPSKTIYFNAQQIKKKKDHLETANYFFCL